jgi:hypothetical protein
MGHGERNKTPLNDPLLSCFVGTGVARPWNTLQATVLRLPAGKSARIASWIFLRVRLALAERRLAAGGLAVVGRYACYPTAASPALVYELGTPAARYAEEYLIPRHQNRKVSALLRRGLSTWAGCDPSVGDIVVIGLKS